MTSAISHNAPNPLNATSASNANAASSTTSPLSGAVPAQLPVRSYANATKTASPAPSAQAGASAQNAKSADTPVNGANTMAHGGSQPNGTPAHMDHGRKPSVVISASGASGQIPNGGPVGQSARPPINFGSMGASGSPLPQQSTPYGSQGSSLPAPNANPRVISPAHSPSPIPQPPASGGRPPSGLQGQSNGMTFGSMGESDPMRQNQMPLNPGMPPMHERRQSSQSMQSDMSNSNMQNRGFMPPGGRGRGFSQQPPFHNTSMPSPGQNYRTPAGQPRANMPPQFQPAPGSPYTGGGRNSPAFQPARPYQQHQQMPYNGYPPHMNQQQMYPHYDPQSGYYQPYYGYGQYQGQPPQSPRPPYPSPYGAPQGQMQAPFHPPDMSRSASQSSQRPPSSLGQPQTPSMPHQAPQSHTPAPSQQAQPAPSASFVKPKKTSAIKITDANGNAINFAKPSPSPSLQAHPQTPVIVSTPNAPTPPPRSTSTQQNRSESQPAVSAEEKKAAFQEQMRRQIEEQKRKEQQVKDDADAHTKAAQEEKDAKSKADQEKKDAQAKAEQQEKDAKVKAEQDAAEAKAKAEQDAADAKAKEQAEAKAKAERDAADAKAKEQAEAETKAKEREQAEAAAQDEIKQAAAKAEKAAAAAAADKEGKEAADAAEKAMAKPDAEKESKEETEEERMDREIAEMEAAELEREARERAFQEKRQREKAEQAKLQAAKGDDDLKRQEREAEEREAARERERDGEKQTAEEPDDEAKAMFASLKKPTLGPGAESSAEGSAAEETEEVKDTMPPAQPPQTQARPLGAQKPKPAHLKLETAKRVEPAEPTPGMQALKSARFLEIKEEPNYPEGFKSPNPALNLGGARKARTYDKDFLLQFQSVFNEKPSVDWDMKVKETLGADDPASARGPQSARTPMARQPSGRPAGQAPANFGGPMGSFAGPRTLPPGTTSQERFAMAQMGGGRPGMAMPGPMGRMPSNLGMAQGMGGSRQNSMQPMPGMGAGSPRQPSARGPKGGSKRGDRTMSKKEEMDMANKMPLTAHMEIAPLQKGTSGWKATSLGQPGAAMAGPDPSGNMAPDMVQRKVKAALNKMTPEKFDKISDQILEIAAQSKNESDGRTLRQVIQLTFEKACDEAHWAGMYAQFCHKMLTTMSTDIRDETIKDKNNNPVVGGALFRKYLLNRCQEEFERGWQANLPEKPEGESQEAALLSDEYYVAAAAKRRGLGLIQFIGQLYKLRMLTIRIMHECVMRLLNFEGDPDEAAVENLTTLLRAVGSTMDADESGHSMMNLYFSRIDEVIIKSDALGSRPKFMIMDLIDLRKVGWKGKDDSKGPKTIEQIHAEAAAAQAKAEAERARNPRGGPGGRPPAGRGDARNFSGGMPPPVDYNGSRVGMDDLRRLQARGTSNRANAGGLGPGGNLGPSTLGARAGSRRGNLGPPASGGSTRTNTPPVDKDKKEEPTQQNAFSALASLDQSGDTAEDTRSEAASPPAARNRSKSPMPADKA